MSVQKIKDFAASRANINIAVIFKNQEQERGESDEYHF
jgi:hypothetical protein